MDNVYATPAARVGKHEWRCCVRPYRLMATSLHPEATTLCTAWEFRRAGDSLWRSSKEWPTYDDHKYDDGLPKSLVKVWERHRPEIYAALGKPEPSPAQAALNL